MTAPRPVKPARPQEAPCTLRLSPMEVERVKRELEAESAGGASAKRVFQRRSLSARSVRMEVQHPGGANTTLNYVPRNLSREGIGVLHSSFVYTGTRCTVFLPHPTRGEVPVAGTIVRCRHFRGKVHELGVRFDQPIDVREYIGADEAEECFALENVAPESLTGGLLLVEPGAMERALIRQHLKDTNVTVTAVESAAEAIKRAAEGYDMVVCSLRLPDGDGLRLHEDLRNAGVQAPFLLLCGTDTTDADRERVRAAQPDGVLAKPVANKAMLAAVGEFLIVRGKDLGGGGAAVFSTLSSRDPLSPHVPEFVHELRLLGDRLGKALAAADAAECRRIAMQIQGSAPTFGFGGTADAATQVISAMQTATNLGEAAAAIRRLVASCHRAQVKRAAA